MICKSAISSLSFGRASVHDLPIKLLQAEKNQIEEIELFYEDLKYVAKALPDGLIQESEIRAAQIIRQLCDERSITIICLQPFWYDESIKDLTKHQSRIDQLKHRLKIAHILCTELILIPSSFLSPELLFPDLETRVANFREVAELDAQQNPTIRFAYEGLCWGTHVNTWEACWEVVRLVDRPNFGICLDTFNIAGRVKSYMPTRQVPQGRHHNTKR